MFITRDDNNGERYKPLIILYIMTTTIADHRREIERRVGIGTVHISRYGAAQRWQMALG
jgi:hypothetical protein